MTAKNDCTSERLTALQLLIVVFFEVICNRQKILAFDHGLDCG